MTQFFLPFTSGFPAVNVQLDKYYAPLLETTAGSSNSNGPSFLDSDQDDCSDDNIQTEALSKGIRKFVKTQIFFLMNTACIHMYPAYFPAVSGNF